MALQIRRGTNAERLTITPLQGELIFTTDTKNVYVGDGTTLGGVAINTDLNSEDVQDIVGPMFTGGTHTGVSFSYNDGNGTINATVTGGGGSGTVTTVSVASANGFAGTVANPTTTPAITLSTTATGILKGNGTAISAAVSGTDYQAPISLTTTGTSGAATLVGNTLNIPQYTGGGGGTPGGNDTEVQFNSGGAFAGSSNLTFDGNDLTVGGSVIGDLSGNVTGNVTGDVLGDLTGNIISSNTLLPILDTTAIVAEYTGNVTGNVISSNTLSAVVDTGGATTIFTGDLTGNVTGNLNGNVTGDVSGNVTGNLFGDVSATTVLTTNLSGGAGDITVQSPLLLQGSIDHATQIDFKKRIVITDPAAGAFITLNHHENTASGPMITFNRSRGTSSVPTSLQVGDYIQRLEFLAYDGSSYVAPLAISTQVTEPVTSGIVPTKTSFQVMTRTGSILESLAFNEVGGVETQRPVLIKTIDPLQNTLTILTAHATAGNSSNIFLGRSRGTNVTPTTVNNGDVIKDLVYGGHDGTTYRSSILLRAVVDDAVSTAIVPGRLEIHTTNASGTLAARVILKNDGVLQVGNIQPLGGSLSISATTVSTTQSLSLASYANAAARDLAITAPVGGMMIYLQDNGSGVPRAQVYLGAPTNAWTDL